MLRGSLKELSPLVETVLVQLGMKPTARPEELDLNQFILLFETLTGHKDTQERDKQKITG